MHITEGNEPVCRGRGLCESIYRTFWKRQNHGNGKNNQWLPGLGGREGRADGVWGCLG